MDTDAVPLSLGLTDCDRDAVGDAVPDREALFDGVAVALDEPLRVPVPEGVPLSLPLSDWLAETVWDGVPDGLGVPLAELVADCVTLVLAVSDWDAEPLSEGVPEPLGEAERVPVVEAERVALGLPEIVGDSEGVDEADGVSVRVSDGVAVGDRDAVPDLVPVVLALCVREGVAVCVGVGLGAQTAWRAFKRTAP